MTNQQIRLQFGEMTASEMRLVKAVLAWKEREDEKRERENKALREMLKESCFYASKNYGFSREGYTLQTTADTADRDIEYRDCKLYATADEAVEAALKEYLK